MPQSMLDRAANLVGAMAAAPMTDYADGALMQNDQSLQHRLRYLFRRASFPCRRKMRKDGANFN
jgi:hypothetical protein